MSQSTYYFTTRDLLLMAALAALGGITSTAINTLGDAVQSVLGFAGTTQWAAGLHVLMLTLAGGLVGKLGAGTITGLLKGGVELLTGNTHGILVVLVDLVAGVLVDLGMLPFRRKDRLLPLLISGGLASASNVFVFQLFAALPADVLVYGTLAVIGIVAGLSGVLFAGLLAFGLLSAFQRSGVIKDRTPAPVPRRARLIFLLLTLPMMTGLTMYVRGRLQGPASITVTGAASQPFTFPGEMGFLEQVIRPVNRSGVQVNYSGYPMAAVVEYAQPAAGASKVLLLASDGYAFFLAMEELATNPGILLVPQDLKGEISFDVVGPTSAKAWVRGLEQIVVVQESALPLTGLLESPGVFDPGNWQEAMDSVTLDVSGGSAKVQGVPLGQVLAWHGLSTRASQVAVITPGNELILELDVVQDHDLRIFSLIQADGIHFVLGHMNGDVLAEGVEQIEVR